jgi:hypothetical protein
MMTLESIGRRSDAEVAPTDRAKWFWQGFWQLNFCECRTRLAPALKEARASADLLSRNNRLDRQKHCS